MPFIPSISMESMPNILEILVFSFNKTGQEVNNAHETYAQ